mgnify:CR=1 FL=1
MRDVQFKLEHLKDGIDYNATTESVTTNWVQIKPKATTGTAQKDYFVTDVSGEISVEDLKPGTYRLPKLVTQMEKITSTSSTKMISMCLW